MSRLSVKDLERIKNGKLVRYNLLTKEPYSNFVILDRLSKEIRDFNITRFNLFKEFRNDINNKLEWLKGSRIDSTYRVSFDLNELFVNGYLTLTIPTIFGDSVCIFDSNGFVGASGEITDELMIKCNAIIPYIKKIYEIKNQSNIMNNEFYDNYPVLNSKNEKVLNINGDGITLPFNDYFDFENIDEVLNYYYCNKEAILKNIIIPNTKKLNNYRLDINPEKVLKLYKGEK